MIAIFVMTNDDTRATNSKVLIAGGRSDISDVVDANIRDGRTKETS